LQGDDWYLPKTANKINSFIGSIGKVQVVSGLMTFVKNRISSLGMTREAFAGLVGVSESHLSNILRQAQQSHASTKHKIPEKAGVIWANALQLEGRQRHEFLLDVVKQAGSETIRAVLASLAEELENAATERVRLATQLAEMSTLVARLSQKPPKNNGGE
jgi:transcriptional regulator with XRE-family HTH domain